MQSLPPLPSKPNRRGDIVKMTPMVIEALTFVRDTQAQTGAPVSYADLSRKLYPKKSGSYNPMKLVDQYVRKLIKSGWLARALVQDEVIITKKGREDLKNMENMFGRASR